MAANETGPHTVNHLQTGGLVSGAGILIQTRDDLTNRGGVITGANALVMRAGGDITLTTSGDIGVTASHLAAGGGLLAAAGGDISAQSGPDVHDRSSVIKRSGALVFGGGGNVDLHNRKTITTSSHTSTNAPASLVAGGDVVVDAGRDVNVKGSLLSAGKHASISAGRDVAISAAREEETHFYSRKETGFGFGWSAKNGSATASQGWRRKSDVIATEATSAAPSLVQGGADVGIAANRDIMISASDIMSGGDVVVAAGKNLSLLAQTDIARSMQSHKESFVGVRATVGENVSGALDQLRKALKTARSGHGGAGYEAIAAASGALQAIDGALQLVNPTVTASVTVGASRSNSSSQTWQETARPATITAGGDIALFSGQDMHLQASQLKAGNDLLLDAGRNLLIESAQPRYGSAQSSSSASASVGVGASAGLTGANAGITASGSYANAHPELQGMANVNALLEAGNTLVSRSGNDTTIAGATVKAPDVPLDVGGNLTIASRQDTERSRSNAFNIGGSVIVGPSGNVSGSLNLGGGYSKSDKAWVNQQTAIIADNRLDIRTGGHTQIDGAIVASRTGDLRQDTGTLTVTDIHDFDKAESVNGQVGVNFSVGDNGSKDGAKGGEASGQTGGATQPGAVNALGKLTGGNFSGSYANHDCEQFTRGMIGAGEIIIRDEANQRQDVASINRDLTKAQEIIKDERAEVEFHACTSALNQIATGFEGIRSGLQNIGAAAACGFGQLPRDIRDAVTDAARRPWPLRRNAGWRGDGNRR